MSTFSLITVNNTISATDADISYKIICSDPNNTSSIKYIEVDMTSLADCIQWDLVTADTGTLSADCMIGPAGGLAEGVVLFTLTPQTNFKACNNEMAIHIANLQKKSGQVLPDSANITFKLKSIGNTVIGKYPDDYKGNTILVANTKPIIHSFKINPSITRESTDVTLTYTCAYVSSCEIKDKSGRTVDVQTGIYKSEPSSFSKKVHLGSEGSFPSPPFYLHAKDGGMEAVDNTVAHVETATSANWKLVDNFSEQVLKKLEQEGTDDEGASYTLQQNRLLDLVLNEYDDMIWAIVQKRTDLSNTVDELPCIWKSSDGLTWVPHTYNRKDDDSNVIRPAKLTIPDELVHCPCVHFGKDELYFVGGSKVDIGHCSNTITVVNLSNGGIRELKNAPKGMKPRSMHGCVIYPDAEGNNNIWVIGGADKNGNGLNDVWRFDGSNWIPVDSPALPKRCQFAATVQTDVYGAKSIWIGGGAMRYNGSTLNDIWVYRGSSWVQVKNGNGTAFLSYSDEWLAAASLCYVRTNKNTVVNALNSYRYILSNDITDDEKKLKCSWIIGKDIDNHQYSWNPIENIQRPELPAVFAAVRSMALTTVGFNGCMWTVAIAYVNEDNTVVSNLYYSCPEP
jgi:Galactose oxidase, central domain